MAKTPQTPSALPDHQTEPGPVSEELAGSPHQRRSMIGDVGGPVGHTLEGVVIGTPDRSELAWDAVLAAAAMFEAVSPAAAVAGIVVNRLIHAAR